MGGGLAFCQSSCQAVLVFDLPLPNEVTTHALKEFRGGLLVTLAAPFSHLPLPRGRIEVPHHTSRSSLRLGKECLTDECLLFRGGVCGHAVDAKVVRVSETHISTHRRGLRDAGLREELVSRQTHTDRLDLAR
jgi:hypothetical protein